MPVAWFGSKKKGIYTAICRLAADVRRLLLVWDEGSFTMKTALAHVDRHDAATVNLALAARTAAARVAVS
jgi:hypothetical protein